MKETLFEGKTHKITTDGRTFFLYVKPANRDWELRDKNSLKGDIYREAFRDLKMIFSLSMPEAEKILKICESGFFSPSNL
jgi:hypothetical protein